MVFGLLAKGHFPAKYAPIIGAVVGAYGGVQAAVWFGKEISLLQIAHGTAMGAGAGVLIWIMEFIEYGGPRHRAPNAAISIVVLVTGLILFWIPMVGFGILTYGLYRARWLNVNDWILFPFSIAWLVSFCLTLAVGVATLADMRW